MPNTEKNKKAETEKTKDLSPEACSQPQSLSVQEFVEKMGLPADIILNNAIDGVLQIQENGTILRANPIATVNLGYTEKQFQDLNLNRIVSKEYQSLLQSRITEYACEDEKIISCKEEDLFLIRCRNGSDQLKTFEAIILPYSSEGEMSFFLNFWEPESNSQKLADQLKKVQKNYEALSETISEAVIIIDETFKILYANSATLRVFGYEKEELIGQSFEILFPEEIFYHYTPEIRKYFYVDFNDRKITDPMKQIEMPGKSKNRGTSPVEISFGNSRGFRERTLTCIIRDVSHRRKVERKLRYLAYHDKLTSLGNRDLFNTDIDCLFEQETIQSNNFAALFFLDLDGFKQVNDTFGHQAGDTVLIETARRLREILREMDLIYRFGGDEFVVLLTKITRQKDAELVASKILLEVGRPYPIEKDGEESQASIGVSIGIALIPGHGMDRETITKNADLAMYSAKERGKNRYIFFSENLTQSARTKWTIDQGLRTALAKKEMSLWFQPILGKDQKVYGVEALLRWNHEGHGMIPPEEFLPTAEENGTIIPIELWALDKACLAIKQINQVTGKNLFVSIDLSIKQLTLQDFPVQIEKALKKSGLNAQNLRLEIPESFLVQNPQRIIRNLSHLKQNHPGIKIVIDGFGKGYSSIIFLSQLPVESIKIDGSLIKGKANEKNWKVIQAISGLTESLHIAMDIQGIETQELLQNPSVQKCRYIQGDLYSKPLPSEQLLSFLQQEKPI